MRSKRPGMVHLIGLGETTGTPASEARVGQRHVFNYGVRYVIEGVMRPHPNVVTLLERAPDGTIYTTRHRPGTLLVLEGDGEPEGAAMKTEMAKVAVRRDPRASVAAARLFIVCPHDQVEITIPPDSAQVECPNCQQRFDSRGWLLGRGAKRDPALVASL